MVSQGVHVCECVCVCVCVCAGTVFSISSPNGLVMSAGGAVGIVPGEKQSPRTLTSPGHGACDL